MIDELSLGLAPAIVRRFAFLALEQADRAVVLQRGRVAISGSAEMVRQSSAHLTDAYLGGASPRTDEVDAR